MSIPQRVRIVEVGPRDGLQNESAMVSVETKVALIEKLAAAGLRDIEAGSFVSARRVPQMADTKRVLAHLRLPPHVHLSVLIPNMRGLEEALACGVRGVAIFAAASESFSEENIGCTITESLTRYAPVVEAAVGAGLEVRGYISCALGCPYEGDVAPRAVATLARDLAALGCHEISLGDTIGVGAPLQARRLVEEVGRDIPLAQIAVHFHDSYGQALANIFACVEMGVGIVDASVAGLGGCPFAPGASGNVATEDVVYMLQRSGIDTGVDLAALIEAGAFICENLGRESQSRAARASLLQRERRRVA
ncbi:hydroxymethylglutaryl-CoA lyase [Methylosinus sp. R-45379]|uniref:hydroxymethylglutaryl-CoA lyase n=1 Tax=Methylosinus sp. R-45379 TaxID=980563 RepID=UPI0007C8AD4A|nr:hydroxymethylglutaryl-CoA lyase [Methylosinus sp. R-45379]OAI30823.1 hydroxymethylglutaryl-CoA lyase [Methylosinus sp. R-45379]